jgi:ankyrin repeat protein
MKELKDAINSYFSGSLNEKYFLKKIKDLKKYLNFEEFHVDEELGFKRKCTPLTFVCIFFKDVNNAKRIIAIRELLKQGANPNGGEILPIVGLAQKGNLDALKVLIEEGGADIDKLSVSYEMKPDEKNKIIQIKVSALSIALNKEHLEVIDFLIEKNARVFHNEESYSPLEYAIKDVNHSLFQRLLGSIKKNLSLYSRNELYAAFTRIAKKPEFALPLFDLVLSPPLSEMEKNNLLIRAVEFGDEILLERIFALGINPNALLEIRGENGKKINRTILQISTEVGRANLVRQLIEKYKADPFCLSEDGLTAFSLAVSKADLDVMKVMLENNKELVNFKNKDEYGRTPLHIAVFKGNFTVVNFLFENGADPSLLDANGYSPFYQVIGKDHAHLIFLFKKHNVNLDAPIRLFSKTGDEVFLRPLTIAIALGHDEFIGELCKAGATLNYKEGSDASPLKVSMVTGKISSVKILLQCGAIPTTDDIDYLLGIHDHSPEVDKIIKIFLQYFQADPKKNSDHIYYLLINAVSRNNAEFINILLVQTGLLNESFIFSAFFKAIIFNRVEVLKIFFAYIVDHVDLQKIAESLMREAFSVMDLEDQNDIKNLYDKYKPKLLEVTSKTPALSLVQAPIQAPLSISPWSSFYQEEPYKSYTSHSYLRGEKQLSDEEIKELKAEIKLKKKKVKSTLIHTSQVSMPEEFTWFDNNLHSSSMKTIENADGPNYIYLPKESLEKQGCNLKLFEKDRYKLDNKSIKILKGSRYTRQFKINGKSYTHVATHELKTQESDDRILLFPVKSDDTSAILYIGAVFKKGGLHDKKDKSILLKDLAERLSVIEINLPPMSPAPTFQV